MIRCAFRVGATEAYVLTIAPHADVSAMSGPKNLIWSPADKSANTPFFKENKSNMPAFWAAFVLLVYPGGWRSQGHVIPPACSGSAPGSPPSRTRPDYLHGEVSRRHPNELSEATSKGCFQNERVVISFQALYISLTLLHLVSPDTLWRKTNKSQQWGLTLKTEQNKIKEMSWLNLHSG